MLSDKTLSLISPQALQNPSEIILIKDSYHAYECVITVQCTVSKPGNKVLASLFAVLQRDVGPPPPAFFLPVFFTSLSWMIHSRHVPVALLSILFYFSSSCPLDIVYVLMPLSCKCVWVRKRNRASVYLCHLPHCLCKLSSLFFFSQLLPISLFLHYCVTSLTSKTFQLLYTHHDPLSLPGSFPLLLIFSFFHCIHLSGSSEILHRAAFLLLSMFFNSPLCLCDCHVWLWFTAV